jgi:hypothetical protein
MRSRKLIDVASAVGALALVLSAAPSVLAQCANARVFGGDAGGMAEPKLNVLTNGTENAGNESGYFWENGTPGNDSVGGGGVGCPSSQWWVLSGPDRRVLGAIASPACQMDVCPAAGAVLNLVVEDATADGKDAAIIMFQVDETPATFRWWDHARVTPGYTPGQGGTYAAVMERFPTVDVKASAKGSATSIVITNAYANLAPNYHGVQGPAHTPTPASTGIAAYEILAHNDYDPPGRARGSWNMGVVAHVPYQNAAVLGHTMEAQCFKPTEPLYLGVAVEFVDGVKSALVGRHTVIACEFIADPDDDDPKKLRPKTRTPQKPQG